MPETHSSETESSDQLGETLIGLERARRDALVGDDMDALAALVADDVVHVHTTGAVHDKAKLIDHAGRVLRFVDVQRGPLQVRRLCNDAAVMTGSMTNIVGRRDEAEDGSRTGFRLRRREDVGRAGKPGAAGLIQP